MATLSPRLKAMRKDGTRPVRIRIAHNYSECEVGTALYVTEKDLDRKGEIKNAKIKNDIQYLMLDMRRKIAEIPEERLKGMKAKDIMKYIMPKDDEPMPEEWKLDFFDYVNREVRQMEADGRNGSAETRRMACRSMQKFLGRTNLDINKLTTAMLNEFVRWLENKNGKGCRAASLYPAQLRASFNKARREFNTDTVTRIVNDPFGHMEVVRQHATTPRSITAEQLRAIAALEDQGRSNSRFIVARDVFLLSFYLIGMNSVDLFNCPPIKDGRITYERTKTKTRRDDRALISIAIPEEALPLIEKYKGHRDTRAFNFCERYATRREFSAALNKGLKEIGKALKIEGLQFYAARHTWATIAVNEAGVDKYTVHQALNHVDGKTAITDIYIRKSWDVIDKANRQVIDYVFYPKPKKENKTKKKK